MLQESKQQRPLYRRKPSIWRRTQAPRALVPHTATKAATAVSVIISIAGHIFLAATVVLMRPNVERKVAMPMRFKITNKEDVRFVKYTPEPERFLAPSSPKKVAGERKTMAKPVEITEPSRGESPNALSQEASGNVAPTGNTLIIENAGKHAKSEALKNMIQADLSTEATLIASSIVVPKYTDEAVNANVETSVTVDVFVDAQGDVTDAEMKKRVGYGMDERILASARRAKFHPRKDKFGRAIAGWSEIKFRLEIPN